MFSDVNKFMLFQSHYFVKNTIEIINKFANKIVVYLNTILFILFYFNLFYFIFIRLFYDLDWLLYQAEFRKTTGHRSLQR